MIVFLGDSFTWGQGLQIPQWLENGKTVKQCNFDMPPYQPSELYNYQEDEIRKSQHFPNLVAKHFNKSYVTKWGNGGSNQDIREILEISGQLMQTSGLDYFVIQFTELTRDSKLEFLLDENQKERIPLDGTTPEQFFETYANTVVEEIDEVIRNYYRKPWFGFSWFDDIGNILKEKYPKNYIPICYDNQEFTSFDILRRNEYGKELTLSGKYQGIQDAHFSKEGHEVLAQSIIKKIESSDLIDPVKFREQIPHRPS